MYSNITVVTWSLILFGIIFQQFYIVEPFVDRLHRNFLHALNSSKPFLTLAESEDDYEEDDDDEEPACTCDKKELFEAVRLVVMIETMEEQISSSRWLKKNREEAAEDLRKIIENSSDCLLPPSKMLLQTKLKEEELILRLLRLCVELRVYEEGLDFLKILMEPCCSRHSWSNQRKYNLLHDLISSPDVWGKLDPTSRQGIINICSSLVHSWIKKICRLLNPINGPNTISIQTYRPDVIACVDIFFLVGKNRLEEEQWITTHAYEPLIAKLPVSVLMDLVLEVHEQEAAKRPNIKKFPICFNWYRDLCRRLFATEVLPSTVSKYLVATRILKCLLWLGDQQSWNSFELYICRKFPAPQCFSFLRIFLKDLEIQKALRNSPIALAAFGQIADNWAIQSASREEPKKRLFSWCRPKAVVPKHPEVQAFLRSSLESMTYRNFSKITEARRFAEYLEKSEDVSVTLSGIGKNSLCVITKTDRIDYTRRNIFSEKAEVAKLVKLRDRIILQTNFRAENVADETITPDEVCVVPTPKRPKLDIPVLELE